MRYLVAVFLCSIVSLKIFSMEQKSKDDLKKISIVIENKKSILPSTIVLKDAGQLSKNKANFFLDVPSRESTPESWCSSFEGIIVEEGDAIVPGDKKNDFFIMPSKITKKKRFIRRLEVDKNAIDEKALIVEFDKKLNVWEKKMLILDNEYQVLSQLDGRVARNHRDLFRLKLLSLCVLFGGTVTGSLSIAAFIVAFYR